MFISYLKYTLIKIRVAAWYPDIKKYIVFKILSLIPFFYFKGRILDGFRNVEYDLTGFRNVKKITGEKREKTYQGYNERTLHLSFTFLNDNNLIYKFSIGDEEQLNLKRFLIDVSWPQYKKLYKILADILPKINASEPIKVFEPGCNVAGVSAIIQTIKDVDFYGCDLHEPSLNVAAKVFPSGTIEATDLFSLSWLKARKDNEFDLLFCHRHLAYADTHENSLNYIDELLRVSRQAVFFENLSDAMHEHLIAQGAKISKVDYLKSIMYLYNVDTE